MSIIRVGLAETKKFAQGYEAIFGTPSKDKGPAKSRDSAKKPSIRAGKKKIKRK